jgi:cell division protein FtsL
LKCPQTARAQSAKRKANAIPQWYGFAIITAISFMLCLAINLEPTRIEPEITQHEQLNLQVETLTTENLAIQQEIQDLKNDKRAIEREARKIGMSRPNEKVLVPAN